MLNWIIRLQVVVEIITNHTASALELLARQYTGIQMCATIFKTTWSKTIFYLRMGAYVANSTIQTAAFKLMTTDKH
jgi:hypothetical protein